MASDYNDTNDVSPANSLCMGCMQARGASEQCPECGWVEGNQPNSPLYLPPRTELNNRYVIGRVLGHGGFGITYLGWDQELHLKVAIKEYLPDGLGTRAPGDRTVSVFSGQYGQDFEHGLENFLAEARTLARFQDNPNIVSIFNYFKENGTAYIVMEYVEGISLKQYLEHKENGRMPLDEALTYIMPVADALSIVHAEGMLHRDVSPDNIYVTHDYRIKLLDFGASRIVMNGANKSHTVLWKPGYAPVEQYLSRGVQGPWTDEYALAATMYKLLSGQTPPESIERMQGMELESLTGLGIDLPASVETVLIKALSVQPQERYQSIEEFRTELNKALAFENKVMPTIDNTEIETVLDAQQETGATQPTSIEEEERSSNLRPAVGRKTINKKALIAMLLTLIFALPATVYGFASLYKFKQISQIASVTPTPTTPTPTTPTPITSMPTPTTSTQITPTQTTLTQTTPTQTTPTQTMPTQTTPTQTTPTQTTPTQTMPTQTTPTQTTSTQTTPTQTTPTQITPTQTTPTQTTPTQTTPTPATTTAPTSSQSQSGDSGDVEANGQGTYTFPDGGIYVGETIGGVPNGQGTETWPDGRKYVGEFIGACQIGQGTETWPDGRKYVGGFNGGLYDGQGTITYRDGTEQSGIWIVGVYQEDELNTEFDDIILQE